MFKRPISQINSALIKTPCYVCEESQLDYNLLIFDYIQEQTGVKILVALKGFALWKTFGKLKKIVHGACASGLWEARLARETIDREVHTFSPAFCESDFFEIIQYSDHLIFNSLSQFERLYPLIEKSNKKVSCGLRINPEYSEIKHEIYDPCSSGSRLGMQLQDLVKIDFAKIEGLHFHSHCQQYQDVFERSLNNFENKCGQYFSQIKWLNFGGGQLFTDDHYDLHKFIEIIKVFRNKYPHLDIYLEPGGAVGWQTGVLVASVVDILVRQNGNIAILDVSFDAHMPDCLIMPYDPEIRGAGESGQYAFEYTFGGNTCLQGDRLDRIYSFPQPLKIGEKIVFDDMIHYTIVKNTLFNGVKLPDIALWTKNDQVKILNSFQYSDYKNRNS